MNTGQDVSENMSCPAIEPGLRPAVFIGLGGAATLVLRFLRRRLTESNSQSTIDAGLRFLALDTDRTTLQDAETAAAGEALLPEETLHLPLRKPAEYRSSSDQILSWLSRRWLYNIPRSLRTEGLRPLGRLAFVDHRMKIADRLRNLLDGAAPRVFIISSIDGGTGGGMLLDVAYAVRQQLDDLKLTTNCLCGLMLHGTVARSPANDLRKANAYATLTELNHFLQGGAAFHSGPLEVLPAGDVSEPPFRDAYLVNLGDEATDAQFNEALLQVADYLFLNVDSCGTALDEFRQRGREQAGEPQAAVRLRSFGLHAIRVDKRSIATHEADRLCLRLARTWLGESEEGGSPVTRIQPPDFGLDDLAQRVQAIANKALDGNAETHFRALIAAPTGRSALWRDDDPAGPFGDELRRIHAVLGLPTTLEGSPSIPPTRLEAALQNDTQKLAAAMGDALVDSISGLIDQSAGGVLAAMAGAKLFQEHLRDLRQGAEEIVRRDLPDATALWLKLQRGELPRQRSWFSRLGAAGDDPEECLLEYCRLRLRAMVHKHLGALLQEVSARIAALSDRVGRLRQAVNCLATEFAASVAKNNESHAENAEVRAAFATDLQRFHEPAYLTEFERSLRAAIFPSGLMALADGEPESLQAVADEISKLAREAVLSSLAGMDAAAMLMRQNPTEVRRDTFICDAVGRTHCGFEPTSDSCRLFFSIAPGPASEAIAAAVCNQFPAASITPAADANLVVLREIEGILLSEAAEQIVKGRSDCAAAARRVLTRVDVPWLALPVQNLDFAKN